MGIDEATARRRRRAAYLVGRELAELTIREAGLPSERRRAASLVHDVYVSCGYIDAEPEGARLRIWETLPSTRTLLVEHESRLIGTASLVLDGPHGLPMDEAFGEELAARRSVHRRIAEVSGLAIAPAHRNFGAFAPLIREILRAALECGVDEIVCAVSPKTTHVYTEILLFEALGAARSYSTKKHDPVVGLRCDLTAIESRIASAYGAIDAELSRIFPLSASAKEEVAA
jgi:hypothetical protein